MSDLDIGNVSHYVNNAIDELTNCNVSGNDNLYIGNTSKIGEDEAYISGWAITDQQNITVNQNSTNSEHNTTDTELANRLFNINSVENAEELANNQNTEELPISENIEEFVNGVENTEELANSQNTEELSISENTEELANSENDRIRTEYGTGGDTGPLLMNIHGPVVHIQMILDENAGHHINEPVIDIHRPNSMPNWSCFNRSNRTSKVIVGGIVSVLLVVIIALIVHLQCRDNIIQQSNPILTSYAFAVSQNFTWKFQYCDNDRIKYDIESDEFQINPIANGIGIIHHQINASRRNQPKHLPIGDACIQLSGRDKLDIICQRISSDLNIPFSIFLAAPIKGEQRLRVLDYKQPDIPPKDRSLLITSWPDAKVFGLVRYHLDERSFSIIKGQLQWIKAHEYGKPSIVYHEKWKLFDVSDSGIYLIILSLNIDAASDSDSVQACIKSADDICRRFVIKGGKSTPVSMIYINKLTEKDKIEITLNNIHNIYSTGDPKAYNSLTIVRFRDVEFSRYHLNTNRQLRLFETLRWKEDARISKIFDLQHEMVFAARKTGTYWVIVSLTIQTMAMENKSLSINNMSACIKFSKGQPHCQNILIKKDVVFPVTLSIVRHISSDQSFRITLERPNLLYKSTVFNSMFVLKL